MAWQAVRPGLSPSGAGDTITAAHTLPYYPCRAPEHAHLSQGSHPQATWESGTQG